MWQTGSGLIFLMLFFSGCASLERPRWALLGDTYENAFFIDSQEVQRQPNGNYHYVVKVRPYQENQVHHHDDSHDTCTVLLLEMNCREKRWTEVKRSVVDQNNKALFRYTNPLPNAQAVESDTIHFAAYNYLCDGKDIVAQHNH